LQPRERAFYEGEVAPYLPPAVLDFHTHIWDSANWKERPWDTDAAGGKYMVVEPYYPAGRLAADGSAAFPDREYRAVVFGYPVPAGDFRRENAFVRDDATTPGLYPLMLAGKSLGADQSEIRETLHQGPFLGYKVFLNWYGNDYGSVTIEDMLSANEMAIANELSLVVLLHVPRSDRLADPVIQEGVRNLAAEYPDAQIVLAHCGRCYLPDQMRRAVGALSDLTNVFLDSSMVMDPLVLRMVIDELGPSRLLFGTDYPVAAMKGRRVRVLDHWVDVVTPGYAPSAYRSEAADIPATYMAVEIAVAVRDAGLSAGISESALHGIFFGNGMAVLERVNGGTTLAEVQARWKRQ
jgi:predicted TIM-barrel fold metal-dependent hydrolase